MKLKSLEITAFGPYPGTERIDFSDLEGITLIYGATGAGKTIIFDAITFAVYGETSGKNRQSDSLRCTFADPKARSKVVLGFEHDGICYTIERLPKQVRAKDRGTGTTEDSESATLSWDGHVLTKTREVNEKMLDIVGLKADQWRQVVMLAQGKFMDFLYAKNEERGTILETIFGIEVYTGIKDKLAEMTKSARDGIAAVASLMCGSAGSFTGDGPEMREFGEILADRNCVYKGARIRELMSSFAASDEAELERCSAAEAEALGRKNSANETFQEAKSVDECFKALEKAGKELELLNGRREEFDRLKESNDRANGILIDVKPAYDARESARKTVGDRRDKLENCKKTTTEETERNAELGSKLDEATAVSKEADEIRTDAQRIRDSLEKYADLESIRNRIAEKTGELETAKKTLESAEAEKAKVDELVDGYRRYLEETENDQASLEKVRQEIDSIGELIEIVQRARSSLGTYESLKSEVAELENDAFKAQSELETANTHYATIMERYIHGQAGILAEKLKDGEACPVCGSTHHPRPASATGDCPKKTDVDKAMKKVTEKTDALDMIRNSVGEAKIKLTTSATQLKTLLESTGIDADADSENLRGTIDDRVNSTSDSKNEYEIRKLGLEERCKKRYEINEYFRKNNDPKEEVAVKVQNLIDEVSRISQSIEVEKTRLEGKSEGLRFGSLTEAKNALADTESRIAKIDSDLSEAQKAKNASDSNLAAAIASEAAAVNELESAEKALVEKSGLFTEALGKTGLKDEEDYLASVRTPEEIAEVRQEIEKFNGDINAKKGEIEGLRKQIDGKTRPDNLAELEEAAHIAEEAYKDAVSVKSSATGRRDRNREAISKMTSTLDDVEKNLAEISEIAELSDAASGELKDANGTKMSFPDYVRSKYFENVLLLAKDRMSHMTGGRYELRRTANVSDNRGRSKLLDIEIVDNDALNSPARAASTLSGGESFKAALALALGLSDAIRESSSGHKIDALFIDEGFGTLDEDESLDQAIDILEDLSGSSTTVCIISHVEKLHERIPKQIVVNYESGKGSSIRLVKD